LNVELLRTTAPKPLPTPPVAFGSVFSDHVFRMQWSGDGWQRPRIEPYGSVKLDMGASVLHYSQSVFEGLKAYLGDDGRIRIFRADAHAARLARSAKRICMPPVPIEAFVEAVAELVRVDARWVGAIPGGALYIRPLLYATEAFLGVRPSRDYEFLVMTCPVGSYAAKAGPARIWVEREAVRAAPGGVGEAKTGGNYAASLAGQVMAAARGYDQVLWTDAKTHGFVEEVGTMNVFFRFHDEIVTPALSGTILPGITRDSLLRIMRDDGAPVVERPVSVDEIRRGAESGRLLEVFGSGTAATVSPVGVLGFEDGDLVVGDGEAGPLAKSLLKQLADVQRGRADDRRNWMVAVDPVRAGTSMA
jgi:branched-chain amino acid aminotransferase